MHSIEPFYNWQHIYKPEDDKLSPFFGLKNSEVYFSKTIYEHYIHPQWDEFGSNTLYLKMLQVDYEEGYCVIELMGEWNDCIENDIMYLKREVIDELTVLGIHKFILIGENVLNFHASDEEYYEEWYQDVEDGWIAMINFREHVLEEFSKFKIDYYVNFGGELNSLNWRRNTAKALFSKVNEILEHRLN
ncbi:MAG: hypothetical protein H6605_03860 [Flavobacteriales bacterium]|nr:hypothetical protein [Flavobacteriales bacterium]